MNSENTSDKDQEKALNKTDVVSSQNISSIAMDFVKENCLSWCNLEFCHLRACEKPELKKSIISGQQIDCL